MFQDFDLHRLHSRVLGAKNHLNNLKNQDQALNDCVAGMEEVEKALRCLHERVRHPSSEVGKIVKDHGDGCFDVLVRPEAPWGHIPARNSIRSGLAVGQMVVVRFFRESRQSPYIDEVYDLPFAIQLIPDVEGIR